MKSDVCNFDGLARIYRELEWLAFGSDLEAARFCHLEKLRGCRRVLILGEGDGRFLEKLLREFPEILVECVDQSPAMQARARDRLTEAERKRVVFRLADVRAAEFPPNEFDAVVTLFFLDCFTDTEVGALVSQLGRVLRVEARWLWADFALPEQGWRRWRAGVWVRGLYWFFALSTGIAVRRLPQTESILFTAGWRVTTQTERQAGMVKSGVFVRCRQI